MNLACPWVVLQSMAILPTQITSQDTENMLETMLGNLIDSPTQQQQQPGKTISKLLVTAGRPDENGVCFV